jgi:hypothetical protein
MHGTPRLSSVAYCILITLLLGTTVAVAQPSATDPICSLPQLQCTSSTTPGNNGDYTWCSKQNVFMNPLQFELPGNVSASFPAPQCAGSSSSALCSAISQVSTAAWRDFSGTTHNLVLVGLQDGAWTVFDFNAESILGKCGAAHPCTSTATNAPFLIRQVGRRQSSAADLFARALRAVPRHGGDRRH